MIKGRSPETCRFTSSRLATPLGLIDVVAPDLVKERFVTDSELARGLLPIPPGLFQGATDSLALGARLQLAHAGFQIFRTLHYRGAGCGAFPGPSCCSRAEPSDATSAGTPPDVDRADFRRPRPTSSTSIALALRTPHLLRLARPSTGQPVARPSRST